MPIRPDLRQKKRHSANSSQIIDAIRQPEAARYFAREIQEACHRRVCPDGQHYIRGYFDTEADAILTAFCFGFQAARAPPKNRRPLLEAKGSARS